MLQEVQMKFIIPVTELLCVVAESVFEGLILVVRKRATEVAPAPPRELRQGSGGAAPSGVQGWNPCRGARGAEPPGKFLKNCGFLKHF